MSTKNIVKCIFEDVKWSTRHLKLYNTKYIQSMFDALKLTLHLIDILNSYVGFFPTLIYRYFVLTQQTNLMVKDSINLNFIQASMLYQVYTKKYYIKFCVIWAKKVIQNEDSKQPGATILCPMFLLPTLFAKHFNTHEYLKAKATFIHKNEKSPVFMFLNTPCNSSGFRKRIKS